MRDLASRASTKPAVSALAVLAAVGFSLVFAQDPPAVPSIPVPPAPPLTEDLQPGAGFRVAPGETYKGDVYRIRGKIDIEGTLDGDLTCLAGTLRIPGRVTGDIFAAGSSAWITGSAGDSVRLYAGDVVIDGPIDGDLITSGGSIRLGTKAVIDGDAQIYAKEVVLEGKVTGDLFVRAGTIDLNGTVGRSANVVVDTIKVGPEARIEGDLTYGARDRAEFDAQKTVGGEVTYEGRSEEASSERSSGRATKFDGDDSSGLGALIFRFMAALLVYAITLRVARNVMPHVESAASDALQSVGVGFIALLTPFAAVITMIGIVTIPLVVLYLLLWTVAFYLSGIPPAVWIGRFVLAKLNRPSPSVFRAFLVGHVILYVAYGLPIVRWPVWWGVTLWGLGALVLGARSYWLARKGAADVVPPAAASA